MPLHKEVQLKFGKSCDSKSRNYLCKKVAIVELFQVQNKNIKLFEYCDNNTSKTESKSFSCVCSVKKYNSYFLRFERAKYDRELVAFVTSFFYCFSYK